LSPFFPPLTASESHFCSGPSLPARYLPAPELRPHAPSSPLSGDLIFLTPFIILLKHLLFPFFPVTLSIFRRVSPVSQPFFIAFLVFSLACQPCSPTIPFPPLVGQWWRVRFFSASPVAFFFDPFFPLPRHGVCLSLVRRRLLILVHALAPLLFPNPRFCGPTLPFLFAKASFAR